MKKKQFTKEDHQKFYDLLLKVNNDLGDYLDIFLKSFPVNSLQVIMLAKILRETSRLKSKMHDVYFAENKESGPYYPKDNKFRLF